MPEAIPFRSTPAQLAVTTPEERLDAIQEQLASLDDEFEPAGSIGTEADLDFPEFGDPFSENFAEEEVLLDRYCSDADIFAGAPRVSSRDARPMLEPSSVRATRAAESERASVDSTVAAIAAAASGEAETFDPPLARSEPANPWPPAPRKSEFRQLFAKLRRG
jgi:hypothetical protein